MFEDKVINNPLVVDGKSTDRWFLVDQPNTFFLKEEYAIYFLTEEAAQKVGVS
jgi:hypothetical protein